jgi:hypothetical protein
MRWMRERKGRRDRRTPHLPELPQRPRSAPKEGSGRYITTVDVHLKKKGRKKGRKEGLCQASKVNMGEGRKDYMEKGMFV